MLLQQKKTKNKAIHVNAQCDGKKNDLSTLYSSTHPHLPTHPPSSTQPPTFSHNLTFPSVTKTNLPIKRKETGWLVGYGRETVFRLLEEGYGGGDREFPRPRGFEVVLNFLPKIAVMLGHSPFVLQSSKAII